MKNSFYALVCFNRRLRNIKLHVIAFSQLYNIAIKGYCWELVEICTWKVCVIAMYIDYLQTP